MFNGTGRAGFPSLRIPYAFVMPSLAGRGWNENEAEIPMKDLLMLAFTIAFFAVALLYVTACEKLR